jgi:hypothetical protein
MISSSIHHPSSRERVTKNRDKILGLTEDDRAYILRNETRGYAKGPLGRRYAMMLGPIEGRGQFSVVRNTMKAKPRPTVHGRAKVMPRDTDV